MLPFHITRKVAIRHKKRREAICFMVERIAIIFYEKSIFDDGNKVEVYGNILVGLTSLLILTADVCIIKQIVKLIMKLKGGDVS